MRKQQIDPIAQAMQILQLVTQRQGQQAGIEQANRGLDLQEANQRQQAQQFQMGLTQDQQRALAQQQQFEKELAYRQQHDTSMLGESSQARMDANARARQELELRQKQLAAEEAFRNRSFALDEPYKKAMTEKVMRDLSIEDAKTKAMKDYYSGRNLIDLLGSTVPFTPEEAATRQAQIQALIQHLTTNFGISPIQPAPKSQEDKNILKTIK